MRRIRIELTPDELANVITAVEHHLEYLADFGEKDYPDEDVEEIMDSYERALLALNESGAAFFAGEVGE